MAARSRRRASKLKQRADNATTLLRMVVTLGGAYLLYQRYQRMEAEDAAAAAAGPPLPDTLSATQPLTAPGTQPLPSSGPQDVAYEGATNDQIDTTRQLNAPQAQSLDPSDVGDQLVSWLNQAAS